MRYAFLSAAFLFAFGTAHSDIIHVPGDQASIQAGIYAAKNGDTVLVAPGTYWENIDFRGKAIIVKGEEGYEQTIINGNQLGAVVHFMNGEGPDSVIEGFTITNGTGYDMPSQHHQGGGIICIQSSPTIVYNRITGNYAYLGGGIGCRSGSSPTIAHSIICGNVAVHAGGAISCREGGSPPVHHNQFAENSSSESGGALHLSTCSSEITDNVFTNNVSKTGGGAICINLSSVTIRDNLFHLNAVLGSVNAGGGAVSGSSSSPVIASNRFIKHTTYGRGGALWFEKSEPLIYNNFFSENAARLGGAAYFHRNDKPYFVNNTFFGNWAHKGGGAICCRERTELLAENTIFCNDSAPEGAEIYLDEGYYWATLTIRYCDLKGGQASVHVGSGSVVHWGAGMIDADPCLADAPRWDYHILHHSPCRDAGWNSAAGLPDEDFEGDPRTVGGTADIGADEFHEHLYSTGEAVAGKGVSMRLIGPPMRQAWIFLGSGILDPPLPTSYGYWHLLPPLHEIFNGNMPSSGLIGLRLKIPSSSPPVLPFQALVRDKLTNPCMLQVH